MNWLEFFFGWLIKGQYEVSILDSIMFYIELIVLIILIYCIKAYIDKKKDRK